MGDNSHAPSVTKRIGEFVLYGMFIAVDAIEIWPQSRLAAVALAFIGLLALLAIDGGFSKGQNIVFGVSTAVVCAAVYFLVPEPLIPDTEVVGTIQPGAQPDPASKCPPPTTQDTWKILIGTSAIQLSQAGDIPLLAVGRCKVLTITKGQNGLSIAADLFDTDGKLIANIKDNTFHALSGRRASIERDNDLSKIIVKDGAGKEILNVHYLKPSECAEYSDVRGIPWYP